MKPTLLIPGLPYGGYFGKASAILFCLVIHFNVFSQQGGVDKANLYLSSLTAEQKATTLKPFYHLAPHEWTFYPPSMMFPTGVAVKDLDSIQKNHLYNFLGIYQSDEGLKRTRAIMDLEIILHTINPSNPHRIPENYFMTIYGTPHQDSLWGWSFQGHHVVLNFTIVRNKVSFTPFFFGTNPAEIRTGPSKGTRTILKEEELAYQLIETLSPEQKQKAIFQDQAFVEIVTFSSIQVGPLPNAGIPFDALSIQQQQLLFQLLETYLSAFPSFVKDERMQRIREEDAGAIWFGWAGSTEKGKGHYYRIQGKTFLVEFDNTQNDANHIHMVWREFDGDFGRDLLMEHYKQAHVGG